MEQLGETKHSPSHRAELFEAIRNYCIMNSHEEISLDSLLQFIKHEIEVKFVDSPTVTNQLCGSLIRSTCEGWIAFEDFYKIFLSWFNQQSSKIHLKIMNSTPRCKTPETSKCSPFMSVPLAFSTPHLSREANRNDLNCSLLNETFYSACESCGRNRSCCEVRNEIESGDREEKLKKHYEQKISTLNKLLTQSEEDNMNIQSEIEKLQETGRIFRKKEQNWYEAEKDLKDHAQQLSSQNHVLQEQKLAAYAELQCLRQQLSRQKKEYEDLLTQYIVMEESKAKWSKERKQLSDANLKISLLESALASKDSLLQEKEERISALDATCKELEESLSFKQNHSMSEFETFDTLLFQSVRNDTSFSSPRRISTHLNLSHSNSKASNLQAELEEAMELCPTYFKSMSNQTYPLASCTATQTEACVISKTMSTQTRLIEKENVALQTTEVTKNSAYVQTSFSIISERSHSDSLKCFQDTSFCSKVEMEVLEVVDASTQIDTILESAPIETRECSIQTEKRIIKAASKRSFSEQLLRPRPSKMICSETFVRYCSSTENEVLQLPEIVFHDSISGDKSKKQKSPVHEEEPKIILQPSKLTFDPSKFTRGGIQSCPSGKEKSSDDSPKLGSTPRLHLPTSRVKRKLKTTTTNARQFLYPPRNTSGIGIMCSRGVLFIPNGSIEQMLQSEVSLHRSLRETSILSDIGREQIIMDNICSNNVCEGRGRNVLQGFQLVKNRSTVFGTLHSSQSRSQCLSTLDFIQRGVISPPLPLTEVIHLNVCDINQENNLAQTENNLPSFQPSEELFIHNKNDDLPLSLSHQTNSKNIKEGNHSNEMVVSSNVDFETSNLQNISLYKEEMTEMTLANQKISINRPLNLTTNGEDHNHSARYYSWLMYFLLFMTCVWFGSYFRVPQYENGYCFSPYTLKRIMEIFSRTLEIKYQYSNGPPPV